MNELNSINANSKTNQNVKNFIDQLYIDAPLVDF